MTTTANARRTKKNPPLRVGIGGPVGSGKTTLTEMLCKAMRERYDLVVKTEHIDRPEIRTMFDILQSEKFQNEFKSIGGYDISDIGRIMHET